MNDSATRAQWLAITIIAAAFVGLIAAMLSRVGGDAIPRALLIGGGAFAGTFVLVLTAIRFVTDRSSE